MELVFLSSIIQETKILWCMKGIVEHKESNTHKEMVDHREMEDYLNEI